MKSKLFVYLPCFFFASCASIVSKSNWPVTVTSEPSGAHVVIKKQNGPVIHEANTPTTVTLKSSDGFFRSARYTMMFTKKGCPAQTVQVSADVNGWYFGNLLFGGGALIGMVFVDPATGAMWKMPDTVHADLKPMASIDNGFGKKLNIVDRNSLPADLQQKLVALN
ncbi:hypothetical protein [Luteolibacter sp. LG18]|uniref:hypothetical protein n=1 Tax=Luteolibacter sp. LG18 TaxID=2819286 RepID=UPI002B30F0E8|nr:hypothetical protein llg_18360 [Luteolibacter sp. LG18]